jgi:hypothetical protein
VRLPPIARSNNATTTLPTFHPSTHPMVLEILSKAPPESNVHQRALFCQPLALSMQGECIEGDYKRDVVGGKFVPPKSTAIPEGWKAAPPVDEVSESDNSDGGSYAICRERWKSDYVMREYCDNNMRAARRRSGY